MMVQQPELGRFMTFELSKEKPIHGWFWYKEGFAPEIVDWALDRELKIRNRMPATLLDPFCGVGTALLAAKGRSLESVGVDASPLAVFVSRAKCDDYSEEDLEEALSFLSKRIVPAQSQWEFELFSPRAAFPKRNYNDILSIREMIEQEEGRVRNLLLLALLSVLPQSSIILKDGGVLKIDSRKRALPAKEIFRRKVKRMVRELAGAPQGHVPKVFLGDARALEVQGSSLDLVLTSPPYLNNIDYSKVYGLELSLLEMSKAAAEEVRMRSIRSFIRKGGADDDALPPEVGEEGLRIPIIGTYFKDMEGALSEMHRVLSDEGAAYIVVSNSVIHETHILVDEILAQMGERIGFGGSEIIVGAERIADVKPIKVRTRESVVVLRK